MSLTKVTFRIDRSGRVVSDAEPPPDYIPWEGAEIVVRRREADYGPDFVRPRDTITVAAGTDGRGSFWLAPGRYTITLPTAGVRRIERHQGTDYDVTLSAEPAEIDLSSLLAGGIEPDDPQYPTLLSQLREDLDAEMAEHMEEIEAAKEAAAQSADDAAQARDAAQGYATDAQQAAQATAADRLAVSQDRQAIETEQAARLAAIEAAGDTQVSRVVDEGDSQVQRVIDAGDELAIVVPDPAPQPDGRVLTTWGGALAYAPDLAAAVAVAGASPALVTIYETGRRGVAGRVSAYGQQTDSGHTWVAVPGSAGDPVLDYHPDGYLLGSHAPRSNHPASTIGMSIVDHVLPAGSQYRVGAVMDASVTPNWARYLVVALTPDGDRLMLGLQNYAVILSAVIDGVATSLGSWGSLDQGDIGTSNWTAVSAWVHRTHTNYTVTARAVDVYWSERFLFRAPLPAEFANSAARAGLAIPQTTRIFGFWLMGG